MKLKMGLNIIHFSHGPRFVTLVFLTVAIFLLSFVMSGCLHTSSVFSNVYILEFQYNPKSTFYNSSSVSYHNDSQLSIKTGLAGICTEIDGDRMCTTQNIELLNTTLLHPVSNFTIYGSNKNEILGHLNLLDLATSFSSKDKYVIFMAALIMLGAGTALMIFTAFFLSPTDSIQNRAMNVFMIIGTVLVFGSCLITHTGAKNAQVAVEEASMGLVKIHIGRKAAAMYWTGFSFLVLVLALLPLINKRLKEEIILEEKKRSLRA